MRSKNRFPPGWDEERVRSAIDHYDAQSEDEAVAEDERGGTHETARMRMVVEEHSDGFVAFVDGIPGVVVGQGDTAEAAFADLCSAMRFHRETFGEEALRPAGEADSSSLRSPGLRDFPEEVGWLRCPVCGASEHFVVEGWDRFVFEWRQETDRGEVEALEWDGVPAVDDRCLVRCGCGHQGSLREFEALEA